MVTPLPHSPSDTARLMAGAPGFAVGWQELIRIPNPAAGAQWTHTVDGRYYERLVSVRYQFVTSAVVANRNLSVLLKDNNGAPVTGSRGGFNVVASSTLVANLMIGAADFGSDSVGATYGYLPHLIVPPGWVWGSDVVSMDVADQFSSIVLVVQRFPSDSVEIPAVS